MRRPLNLARHPFRNERLPTLLLSLGCVVLLAISVRHAFAIRDLLPERTAAIDGEVVKVEEEAARLRREAEELRRRSASKEDRSEWAAVGQLVDRRAFSWTTLLACLEETVPADVRLLSIAPSGESGRVELTLRAVGRTVEDGLGFLDALLARDEFQEPFLTSVAERDEGVEFGYTMIYVAGRPPEEES
jgi:Tfp pilus assembly protein PilN